MNTVDKHAEQESISMRLTFLYLIVIDFGGGSKGSINSSISTGIVFMSLEDLKFIVHKKKVGKETVEKLEALFERFVIPDKISIKPVFR